jgi:hypothetical protein
MQKKATRRDLLTLGAMAIASTRMRLPWAQAMSTGHGAEGSGWKPGDPIGYINPKIPEFKLPPYRGDRYQASVPDTLDIAERARLAVNALTAPTDEAADYEVYPIAYFKTNPPCMIHNCWYFPYEEDWMGALTRTRLVSGSEQNMDAERRWMEVTLRLQGPDGLIYRPVNGRPWTFVWWQVPGVEKPRDQILQPYACGCMLRTISLYAQRDPDGPWKNSLRRLVDGLISLAVVDGDYAYFWPSQMFAIKNRPVHPPMSTKPFECEGTNIVLGLVDAYRVLGYEPGRVLTKRYLNYLRHNFYGPDGTFYSTPGVAVEAHSGAHLRGLLAMEKYAETTSDKEIMDFVVRAFERCKLIGANIAWKDVASYQMVETPGAGLVGFYPEWTNSAAWQTSETDQVVDMIELALRLSEAGVGDYWDDADRWIRNQFAENQLVETEWIDELGKTGSPAEKAYNVCIDRVPERIKGGYAGSPSVNDWLGRSPSPQMSNMGGCCTAYGSNGLAWVWDRIMRYKDGRLRVNLLLNRASPWADVDSYIPYEGRVEVKIKKAVDLSIRIPEWVSPDQARGQVNKQARTLRWEGRYAKLGDVKPGDVATLTFPIFERTDQVWIEKRAYKLVRKGNEVISIDPPGVYHPLYQRQRYRQNDAPLRNVSRFVSSEMI